jgi:hypothetical protein
MEVLKSHVDLKLLEEKENPKELYEIEFWSALGYDSLMEMIEKTEAKILSRENSKLVCLLKSQNPILISKALQELLSLLKDKKVNELDFPYYLRVIIHDYERNRIVVKEL